MTAGRGAARRPAWAIRALVAGGALALAAPLVAASSPRSPAAPAAAPSGGPSVRIGWVAAGASRSVADGVTLGAEEAARLLALLGGRFALETAPGAPADALRALRQHGVRFAVVALDPARAAAAARAAGFGGALLATEPGPLPPLAGGAPPAVFAVASTAAARERALAAWRARGGSAPDAAHAAAAASAVDWDAALEKNGAAQLNERYRRRFGAPMDEGAWHGWAAVKAAAEAALRTGAAGPRAALAALTFDAHLGAPLRFAADGALVHPLLVRRGDGSVDGPLAPGGVAGPPRGASAGARPRRR